MGFAPGFDVDGLLVGLLLFEQAVKPVITTAKVKTMKALERAVLR